jgi:hypothetical protein
MTIFTLNQRIKIPSHLSFRTCKLIWGRRQIHFIAVAVILATHAWDTIGKRSRIGTLGMRPTALIHGPNAGKWRDSEENFAVEGEWASGNVRGKEK